MFIKENKVPYNECEIKSVLVLVSVRYLKEDNIYGHGKSIEHLVNLFYVQLDLWFLQLFMVNFVSDFSCLYISCVFFVIAIMISGHLILKNFNYGKIEILGIKLGPHIHLLPR